MFAVLTLDTNLFRRDTGYHPSVVKSTPAPWAQQPVQVILGIIEAVSNSFPVLSPVIVPGVESRVVHALRLDPEATRVIEALSHPQYPVPRPALSTG